MIKEIKYGGLSASPSDYESPEGDLAAVIGSVPEEGSLSPVLPPLPLFKVDDGSTVVFVHETAYIRNYIIKSSDNQFTWRADKPDEQGGIPSGSLPHEFTSTQTIHQVNAIGNTVVILADDGMHYFLWKGSNDGYLYLGTHMPELEMNFGLKGHLHSCADPIELDLQGVTQAMVESESFFGIDRDGQNIPNATNAVLGMANRFINSDYNGTRTGGEGRSFFLFPFLVRYTYRLYDGSCVMHSSPVLMPCTLGPAMQCIVESFSNGYSSSISRIHGIAHDLDYYITQDSIDKLRQWNDIVKSIDIFISKPFFTYDQNKTVTRYRKFQSVKSYSYGHIDRGTTITSEFPNNYQKYDVQLAVAGESLDREHGSQYRSFVLDIPQRDEKDVIEEIKSCHTFYFLYSIDVNTVLSERTVVPIESGYINNITQKETLVDDYNSHDSVIAKFSYEYNARLNLANLRLKLFNGFSTGNSFFYTDKYQDIDYTTRTTIGQPKTVHAKIYYFIKQDNKDIIVEVEESSFAKNSPFIYLYHPNRNVYKALVCIIDDYSSISKKYELPMVPHQTLNGSFFFDGLDFDIESGKYEYTGSIPTVTPDKDKFVEIRNKVYTSEANNPFYFPALGINTVGTGEIYSIRSAAKALSQGQFGQFPLYAFTSEGVWALEVASNGTFSAKQPITRDVCINPNSITQLDNSVLFATDRGIMLLSGSESTCITDSLDYQQVFDITQLPHIEKLVEVAGLNISDLTYDSFHEFLLRCKMLYAYNLQRIIVYSTKADGDPYPYAYVYSLKSKSWGMMPSTIASSVPSYPEALAMHTDHTLVDYSSTMQSTETQVIKGMLITRPLKLDMPDVLKTVDTVIQRGNFKYGHVKSAIYGSRDMINWILIWTSTDHYMRGFRGNPYKYFRIVSIYNLDQTESLFGASIQFTPRFQNRLR